VHQKVWNVSNISVDQFAGFEHELTERGSRDMSMRYPLSLLFVGVVGTAVLAADLSTRQINRIREAAMVLKEIHKVPDKDIPRDLWSKAECVLVVPSLKKAAFIVGGEYGKGLMSCRHEDSWTAPVFMEVGKGSWGLQIGAQTIDLVLLIMNRSGADKMLRNKVSLGAEASVAAGPVGRDTRAATDAQLQAEILSYSRTQGLFAGVNLSGGVVRTDQDDNQDLYGAGVAPRDVLAGGTIQPPAATDAFMAALKSTK
jgi:SH3 domain-containing YSC84-like protein 1